MLFTLSGAETLNETETDNMATVPTVPNGISVLAQYERLLTILYKSFFIGSVCVPVSISVNVR